ncbi:MAG: hypothetical protein PHW54_04680 [Candidatus Omnitrophica bacterium]|nr:hypothetical protein [Candidatus Omnitrophota bacterium]
MDVFFNELSIKSAEHITIAHRWMIGLLTLYKIACENGFKDLRMSVLVPQQAISTDYTIYDWAYDKRVDMDTRMLFLTEMSKRPYVDELLEGEDASNKRLFEFKYNGKTANGLGAAYMFDSLAISIDNDQEWDKTLIELNVTALSEDADSVINTVEQVVHASKSSHLTTLKSWLLNRKKNDCSHWGYSLAEERGIITASKILRRY